MIYGAIQRSHYPMPTVEELLPDLHRAKVFSVADTGMLSSTMLVPCWPLSTLHMVAIGGYECRLDWILLLRSFSADKTRQQKDSTKEEAYRGHAEISEHLWNAVVKETWSWTRRSWNFGAKKFDLLDIYWQVKEFVLPRQGQSCTEHADTNRCFRCKKICGIRYVLQQISTKT